MRKSWIEFGYEDWDETVVENEGPSRLDFSNSSLIIQIRQM